jgi:hypothetical protein
MSELRTKIAAGVTILALGGLGGVALSHPQAPPPAVQVQSASKPGKQAPVLAAPAKSYGVEQEAADD